MLIPALYDDMWLLHAGRRVDKGTHGVGTETGAENKQPRHALAVKQDVTQQFPSLAYCYMNV